MQWDEDIWEDISEPPSPGPGETTHLFSRFNAECQLSRHDSELDDDQEAVRDATKFRRHSVDLSECCSLMNDPQEKTARSQLDLKDLHKIAQELIESYQTVTPLRCNGITDSHEQELKRYQHEPQKGIRRGENQNQIESPSSTPKSFEPSLTKSAPKKIYRTSQSNNAKDPALKVGLKNNKSKPNGVKHQSKSGAKTSNANTTKVPQLLCKLAPPGPKGTTALQNGVSKKVSHTSAEKSRCRFTENPATKDISLHEYKKRPAHRTLADRYRDYNNYHLGRRTAYADLYDDEEEDRAKAIVCVVFCIMGLGLIVGIVCLISRYAEQASLETSEMSAENIDIASFLNEIYYRRVADVIRLASKSDDARPGSAIKQPRAELCNTEPNGLLGNTTDVQLNITVEIEDLLADNFDVEPGGEWKPTSCISRHRVAVIIPYRDRWNHLKVLLHYLIPTLKRQQIHFRIFVVEQYGNETFNKGSIMNAAFRESLKLYDFHCVTFHDVDLVPEDDRNMYTCTEQPKHMSHSIDKFQYILPYQGLVGGVLMFKREQFQLVNGYSNMYWGWGAEDDDMTTRILVHGLRIYRPPSNIAKYKMVKHDGRKSSEVAIRMRLLRSAAKRSKLEGLNNVKYTLLFTHMQKLFTHFIVDIGIPIS